MKRKSILALTAMVCLPLLLCACSNGPDEILSELQNVAAAEMQVDESQNETEPDQTQFFGIRKHQQHHLDIGFENINYQAPARGKLVAHQGKIMVIDNSYNIVRCDRDGGNAELIYSQAQYIGEMELAADYLFFIDEHTGLFGFYEEEIYKLADGEIGSFCAAGGKLFYNLIDHDQKTNTLFMCDYDGSNQVFVAQLDTREDAEHMHNSLGRVIGQQNGQVVFAVYGDDLTYHSYDTATADIGSMEKDSINMLSEAYIEAYVTHTKIDADEFSFYTEPTDGYEHTLCIHQNDVLLGQIVLRGDQIYMASNYLYAFDAHNNIEYFELS